MSLDALLNEQVLAFMAVFARVGAFLMTAPALSERMFGARFRLTFAIAVTALLTPIVGPLYTTSPDNLSAIVGLLIGETVIGLFIALTIRFLMTALNYAGQAISLQSSLAMAQSFDPTQQIQGAIIGSFLGIFAVTLIFITDLHHLLLAAMRDSFILFPPGAMPPLGDMSQMLIDSAANAFSLGVRLAGPFLVVGFVIYSGLGILSRLMPTIQIFFIAMPINITIGLTLLTMLLGVLMSIFLNYFEAHVAQFLAP